METVNELFMHEAIAEARLAIALDEVPVGAVIVRNNQIIAKAHNLRETTQQASAHAEMLAIKQACEVVGYWRLDDCDIYITMEPCLMCCGAIINSRIANVYYGARDTRIGCVEGALNVFSVAEFNHHPNYQGGILEKECSAILSEYFKAKRNQSNK